MIAELPRDIQTILSEDDNATRVVLAVLEHDKKRWKSVKPDDPKVKESFSGDYTIKLSGDTEIEVHEVGTGKKVK